MRNETVGLQPWQKESTKTVKISAREKEVRTRTGRWDSKRISSHVCSSQWRVKAATAVLERCSTRSLPCLKCIAAFLLRHRTKHSPSRRWGMVNLIFAASMIYFHLYHRRLRGQNRNEECAKPRTDLLEHSPGIRNLGTPHRQFLQKALTKRGKRRNATKEKSKHPLEACYTRKEHRAHDHSGAFA